MRRVQIKCRDGGSCSASQCRTAGRDGVVDVGISTAAELEWGSDCESQSERYGPICSAAGTYDYDSCFDADFAPIELSWVGRSEQTLRVFILVRLCQVAGVKGLAKWIVLERTLRVCESDWLR